MPIVGGLRTFEQLARRQDREKHVFVELRGGLEFATWTLESGTTWEGPADVSLTWDDAIRDIVGVKTNQGALTRRESLADVNANAGTFFYLLPNTLYIRLPDSTNPNSAPNRVVAQFGFFFSNVSGTYPTLGRELILNGDFEDDLTSWTQTGGSAVITSSTVEPLAGAKSALWNLNAAATNNRILKQLVTLVANQDYRLLFLYAIRRGSDSFFKPIILDPSGDFLQDDGRSYDPTGPTTGPANSVRSTLGETRLAYLDFRTKAAGAYDIRFRGQDDNFSGTVIKWDDGASVWDDGILKWDTLGENAGEIRFDNVSLLPIHRLEPHEPRLSVRIPSVELGAGDVFFEAQKVGGGSISLVNADGFMDELPSAVELVGHDVFLRQGGRIAGAEGTDVPSGAMVKEFSGTTRGFVVSDQAIEFRLEDSRRFLLRNLPKRVYTDADWGDLDPALEGKPRPLWYGDIDGISPNRVDTTGNGYGIYELADPDDMLDGIDAVDTVHAYADVEAADAKDTALRILLTLTTDYTVALTTAQLTLVRDARIIEIDAENNAINFDDGAAELTAFIANGVYIPATLATEVASRMTTASANTITCTYSESTHKFTISTSGGTLNLLTKTGSNSKSSAWSELGFEKKTDRTGATTYTSEIDGFTSPEADHFLRVKGRGAMDDSSGTITGIAAGAILKSSDMLRALWTLDLGQPADTIDEVSFVAARTLSTQTLGVYIRELIESRDIFLRFQHGDPADISVDGDGRLRYLVQQLTVIPADVVYLNDADFFSFETLETAADIYTKVIIKHLQDPSTGIFLEVSKENTLIPVLHDRTNVKTFETWQITTGTANNAATDFLTLAEAPPNKVTFVANVAETLVPGQKFLITRRRGVDSSGALVNNLFRILSVKKQPEAGTMQVTAAQET